MILDAAHSCLLVVDMQEKLLKTMSARQRLEDNCRRLVKGAGLLNVPIVPSEQYPKGLGLTAPELAIAESPVVKMTFSCAGVADYMSRLIAHGRTQMVITGIEAHVCVLQTALDLKTAGYPCAVVSDAVSARSARNHRLACARMRDHGIDIVTTEMVLFEWIRTAEHPIFKEISALVK